MNDTLKKIFDYSVSLISLILLFPLFIVLGLIIKLESKGPVFFKQERLGKNQKIFKIYKFRTMVNNAEKIGSGIFATEQDKRITKIGKFLRKTSLDELPQIINILKGEMSFVGPRPPVTYHPYKVNEYSLHKAKRFQVKPGITGLAQVSGRNNLTWDERIEYDVEYVKEKTFIKDIIILLKTFIRVMFIKNIYKK